MNPRTADRVVGGFVLVCGAALAGLLAVAAFGEEWTRPAVHYTLVLDHGHGISPGVQVTVSGMRVGRVEDVRLTLDRRVELVLHVDRRFQPQVRQDTRGDALLTMSGKVVEIGSGSPTSPVLDDGGALVSGTNFDPLVGLHRASVVTGLAQAERLLAAIEDVLNELDLAEGGVPELIARLVRVLDDVIEGRGTVGKLLADDALFDDLTGAVGDVRGIVTELGKLSEVLASTAEELDRTGDAVQSSAKSLEVTGSAVERSSSAVEGAVDDIPPALAKLERTLVELERTLKAIQQLPLVRGKVE